jgi:hypothetical protein
MLKFYFASIISVRSNPLREKKRIRIQEAQKHVDPEFRIPDTDPNN